MVWKKNAGDRREGNGNRDWLGVLIWAGLVRMSLELLYEIFV